MEKLFSQQKLLLSKTQIRQEISLLKIPNKSVRDTIILLQLEKLNHKIILGFMPIKLEPDIMPFLIARHEAGVIVGLPSVIGNKMIFKVFNHKLKRGQCGLLEPDTDQVIDLTQPNILGITPLVACTTDGKRLGRGGGYYDRFYSNRSNILKVGVCYKEQILTSIPTELLDIKLDRIIYF